MKWLETNWRAVVTILIVISIVTGLTFFIKHFLSSQEINRQVEYSEIMKIDDDGVKYLKLEDFAKKYKNKNLSTQALLELAAYYEGIDNAEKAVSYYVEALDGAKGNLIYYVVIEALTPIYISLQRYDELATLYENASKMVDNPWPSQTEYGAANIYELSGNFEKAIEIYKKLALKNDISQVLTLKVEEQLIWLTASK